MKKYIAATKQEKGRFYSYVIPITENDNLVAIILREHPVGANVFNTLKQAKETVDFWNYTYMQNGTYLFAE